MVSNQRSKELHSETTLGARDRKLGVILVLPIVIFMLILVAYPLVNMFILSVQNYNILSGTGKFVAFKNFINIFKNTAFWKTLWNTVVYSFCSLIPCTILGTLFAIVLNRKVVCRSVIRSFVIFPYLMPMVVCAAMFRFMFNDLCGVLDHWLQQLGVVDKTLNLFGNPKLAMIGVIGVTVWKYTPMIMIAVLGRLQIIPNDLYEAAKIDGANEWECFKNITFPFILPTLIVVMLMRIIYLFNKWDLVYLLTGGGPLGKTETLPTLLYSEAFSTYNFGKASAIGVVMFFILIIVSRVFYKMNDAAERWM